MSGKTSRLVSSRWQPLTKPANLIQNDPTRQAQCLLKHLVKRPTKHLSLMKRQSSSSSGLKALNPAIPGPSHHFQQPSVPRRSLVQVLPEPYPSFAARQVKPSQTARQLSCQKQAFRRTQKARSEWQQTATKAVSICLRCSAHSYPAVSQCWRYHRAWKSNFGWKRPSSHPNPLTANMSAHSIFELLIILEIELRGTKRRKRHEVTQQSCADYSAISSRFT